LISFSLQEDIQTNAQATIDALATNAERLLILFDDILTADEITRTSIKKNIFFIRHKISIFRNTSG